MLTDWLLILFVLLLVGLALTTLYFRQTAQRQPHLRTEQHEPLAARVRQLQEQQTRLEAQCAQLERALEEQAAQFRQLLAEQEARWSVVSGALVLALGDYPHLDEFLDKVAALIQTHMHYNEFGIGLIDAAERIVYRAGYGVPDAWKGQYAQAPGEGIVGWVLEHGQPLIVPDVRLDTRYVEIRPSPRSEVCVPFCMHGQVLGVINAESDRVGTFTEYDVELLTTLTSIVVATLKRLIEDERAAQKLQALTPRERKVFGYLCEGLGNNQVARQLGCSPRTVANHLTRIYAKLEVTSRAEAISWARKHRVFGDRS